jgi:hypothetical protein
MFDNIENKTKIDDICLGFGSVWREIWIPPGNLNAVLLQNADVIPFATAVIKDGLCLIEIAVTVERLHQS